jgi:S-adenosylmethionine:tRNA ribosyltransferase-isomerase
MLVVDRRARTVVDHRIADLPDVLREGDLLVVNDAATVPASLEARTESGEAVEVRLAARLAGDDIVGWTAVLFGEGSFRDDTDRRPGPPPLGVGSLLVARGGLVLRLTRVHAASPRLVDVALGAPGGRDVMGALYAAAEPVRYSYLKEAVPLEAFQTAFATRAWAVEMPSAARPLTWRTLLALCRRGIGIASVTHAAGLSATGDPRLDRLLPFPERYHVDDAAVRAIAEARGRGGRVIAAGTTVVRALEGAVCAHGGALAAGAGVTDLRIGPTHRLRVVDGLLTNVHAPGESHHELMRAFADDVTLRRAHRAAREAGYVAHEFGDTTLIL